MKQWKGLNGHNQTPPAQQTTQHKNVSHTTRLKLVTLHTFKDIV